MKLTKATYEKNGKEIRIVAYKKGVCIGIKDVASKLPTHTDSIVKDHLRDSTDAYMTANEALLKVVGGRKGRKNVANVTNSEIVDFANVVNTIAGIDDDTVI